MVRQTITNTAAIATQLNSTHAGNPLTFFDSDSDNLLTQLGSNSNFSSLSYNANIKSLTAHWLIANGPQIDQLLRPDGLIEPRTSQYLNQGKILSFWISKGAAQPIKFGELLMLRIAGYRYQSLDLLQAFGHIPAGRNTRLYARVENVGGGFLGPGDEVIIQGGVEESFGYEDSRENNLAGQLTNIEYKINNLRVGQGGEGVIPKIRYGLLINRVSSSEIEVGAGECSIDLENDRYYVEFSPTSKTINTSVDGWKFIFLTYDPLADVGDWAIDIDKDGANLAPNLAKRLIGAYEIINNSINDFVNKKPNLFEFTANSFGRIQSWDITNTGENRLLNIPPIPLVVSCLFGSGLSANGGFYRLRFSSPNNILPVGTTQAGDSNFNADIYSRFNSSSPNYGDVIIKNIYTENSNIFAQKSGDPFLASGHQASCQILSFEILE